MAVAESSEPVKTAFQSTVHTAQEACQDDESQYLTNVSQMTASTFCYEVDIELVVHVFQTCMKSILLCFNVEKILTA